MGVSISVSLADLTPEQVAELFCDFNSGEQAEFFNRIAEIARSWPGAGWCQQACEIVRSREITDGGREAIRDLGWHLAAHEAEPPLSALSPQSEDLKS